MPYTVDEMKKDAALEQLAWTDVASAIDRMIGKAQSASVPLDTLVSEGKVNFYFQSSEKLKSFWGKKNPVATGYFVNALNDLHTDLSALFAKLEVDWDVVGVFAERVKESQGEGRDFAGMVILEAGAKETYHIHVAGEFTDKTSSKVKYRGIDDCKEKSVMDVESESQSIFVRPDKAKHLDGLIAARKDIPSFVPPS